MTGLEAAQAVLAGFFAGAVAMPRLTNDEARALAAWKQRLISAEFNVPAEPREQRRLEFARWLAQHNKISG